MTILVSPLDATDTWLSEILGSHVEIVANEPIADAGIISPVARLRLNSAAGPSSVIVKCAPSDNSFRTRLSWALKSETLFYRDIGERAGMPRDLRSTRRGRPRRRRRRTSRDRHGAVPSLRGALGGTRRPLRCVHAGTVRGVDVVEGASIDEGTTVVVLAEVPSGE